jgi:hypothetical protein
MTIKKKLENQDYFNWLYQLRASGQINMFGSVSLMIQTFDLERQQAQKLFEEWSKNFSIEEAGKFETKGAE